MKNLLNPLIYLSILCSAKAHEHRMCDVYLQAGPQTQITASIQRIGRLFHGTTADKIQQIFGFMAHLQHVSFDRAIFRKRTAHQIISDGTISGCTDATIVFVALARACAIPAKYIETIDKEWLLSDGPSISGHIYAEIYEAEQNQWILVDPTNKKRINVIPNNRVLFKIGLDSWDVGITDYESLSRSYRLFKTQRLEPRKNNHFNN